MEQKFKGRYIYLYLYYFLLKKESFQGTKQPLYWFLRDHQNHIKLKSKTATLLTFNCIPAHFYITKNDKVAIKQQTLIKEDEKERRKRIEKRTILWQNQVHNL